MKPLDDKLQLVQKRATQLSPSELDGCYKLVRRMKPLYVGAGEGWSMKQKISEMKDTPGLIYLIFFSGRDIVAFASYTEKDKINGIPCVYLWEIHVDPAFRRHGLGRRLVAEVSKKSVSTIGVVMLRCFKRNHRARKFYAGEGFVPEETIADKYSVYLRKNATKQSKEE